MSATTRVIGDGGECIPEAVLSRLGGVTWRATAQSLADAALASGWPILVVTTDRATRRAATAALRRGGFRTFACRTSKVCDAIDTGRPAVLLLDLTMPALQGFRILQEVHEAFEGRVPVVALTHGADGTPAPRGWDWGLGRQGLGGYVEKPFSPEHLVLVVYQVLVQNVVARQPRLRHLSGREIPLDEMRETLRSKEALEVRVEDLSAEWRRKRGEQPATAEAWRGVRRVLVWAVVIAAVVWLYRRLWP
jgi:DNA-binding response OmpR family regulator